MADKTVAKVEIQAEVNTSQIEDDAKKIRKILEKSASIKIDKAFVDDILNTTRKAADDFNSLLASGVKVGFGTAFMKTLEEGGGKLRSKMVDGAKAATEIMAELQATQEKFDDRIAKAKTEESKKRLRTAFAGIQEEMKLKAAGQADIVKTADKQMREEIFVEKANVKRALRGVEEEGDLRKRYLEFASKRWGEQLQSGATLFGETLDGALTQSFDPKNFAGFLKSLSEGVKSAGAGLAVTGGGMGGAGKVFGQILGKLGSVIGVLGAVAGGFAAVVKTIIDADAQAKDFNRTLMDGVGPLDLLGDRSLDLSQALRGVRDSLFDTNKGFLDSENFQRKWGTTAKETAGILTAFVSAGYTFREMALQIKKNTEGMDAFQQAAEAALVYSKLLGVSTVEVATTMATQMEEFGLSLKGVKEQFSAIAAAAKVSGFSTKRFYSMVLEATSGVGLYNVRMQEATELLLRFGKYLGTRLGGQFLKSMTDAFRSLGMQDRMKKVMLAGSKNTASLYQRSAENAAAAFMGEINNRAPKMQEEFKKAFTEAGITVDTKALASTNAKERAKATKTLVAQLGKLSPQKQESLLGRIQGADADLARRMSVLLKLTKGSTGKFGEMAKNLEALGPGGVLAMQVSQATARFGKPLHRLNAVQLAAFENFSGVSGEQLTQLKEVTKGMYASFAELTRLSELAKDGNLYDTKTEKGRAAMVALQMEQVKKLGAFVNQNGEIKKATIRNGKIIEAQTAPIKNQKEFMLSMGDRLKEATAKGVKEDTQLARITAKQTTDATKILKQGVEYFLNRIYGVLLDISAWFGGMDDTEKERKQELMKQYKKQADTARKGQSVLSSAISQLQGQLTHTTDKKAKEQIKAQIKNYEKQSKFLAAQQAASDKKLDAVRAYQGGKGVARSYTKEEISKRATKKAGGVTSAEMQLRSLGLGKALDKAAKAATAKQIESVAQDQYKRTPDAYKKYTSVKDKKETAVKNSKTMKWEQKNRARLAEEMLKREKQKLIKPMLDQKKLLSDDQKKLLKQLFGKLPAEIVKAESAKERAALGAQMGLKGAELESFTKQGTLSKDNEAKLAAAAKKNPGIYKKYLGLGGITGTGAGKVLATQLAGALLQGANAKAGPAAPDFLLRMSNAGKMSVLQKFSAADGLAVAGTKPGGALVTAAAAAQKTGAPAAGKGQRPIVNITINGNEEKAYQVVRSALKTAGVV